MSVVVVLLDTLRADALLDGRLEELNAFATIARESYVFKNAIAQSNWTLPSHASLFTGLYPHENCAHPPYMKMQTGGESIAEVFTHSGFRTICITCNPWISPEFGMTRGFSYVWQAPSKPERWIFDKLKAIRLARIRKKAASASKELRLLQIGKSMIAGNPLFDNGARNATRRIETALSSKQKIFLFANLMEMHNPYYARGRTSGIRQQILASEVLAAWEKLIFEVNSGGRKLDDETTQRIQQIYWESAKYLDGYVRRIYDAVSGRSESTYLIVASDHGQLLGETNELDHLTGLTDKLIRVPLMIRPPGGVTREDIDWPVEIRWVYKLLRGIAEGASEATREWLVWSRNQRFAISERHQGTIPYVRAPGVDNLDYSDRLLDFKRMHDHNSVACVTNEYTMICHMGRRPDELFPNWELDGDVAAMSQLESRKKEELDQLHEDLRERLVSSSGPQDIRRTDETPLLGKEAISQAIIAQALDPGQRPALLWTGGKDSTLVLFLSLAVSRTLSLPPPSVVFIDHGQHFPETWDFMKRVAKQQGLTMIVARNESLVRADSRAPDELMFSALDRDNQVEALRAGQTGEVVQLTLDTSVGNHLLKTVALNKAIRANGFGAVITGIRWDENPARSTEVFFSSRENPPHLRVHPLLPWREREIWEYTLQRHIPIHSLYFHGYRSFDGMADSKPTDTRPAWEQELESTEERRGRAQDKEQMMRRLRQLGYF